MCKKGKCICPKRKDCPPLSERVCGSDGQVYTNECHMKAESCKLGKTLLDVGMEKCCKFALRSSLFCLFIPADILGQISANTQHF